VISSICHALSTSQNFPDLGGKFLFGKRFLDHGNILVENASLENDVCRIPGHEQYAQYRVDERPA
jgi:hypothetical protein